MSMSMSMIYNFFTWVLNAIDIPIRNVFILMWNRMSNNIWIPSYMLGCIISIILFRCALRYFDLPGGGGDQSEESIIAELQTMHDKIDRLTELLERAGN